MAGLVVVSLGPALLLGLTLIFSIPLSSHYDVSGRIRKGPAPLNLEVPKYTFIEDHTKLLVG